jgi:U5 small nuclear ribonucleoprotein component
MEPLYAASMIGRKERTAELYNILARRRGHVLTDGPVAGTPLYRVDAVLPVIDSFGFESDVRIETKGTFGVSLAFGRWQVVPGDPLDRTITLRHLQAADHGATARDFMLKTRRRKGLSEDVSVAKFLEPEFYQSLLESHVLE